MMTMMMMNIMTQLGPDQIDTGLVNTTATTTTTIAVLIVVAVVVVLSMVLIQFKSERKCIIAIITKIIAITRMIKMQVQM
jgi:hypothetical protein